MTEEKQKTEEAHFVITGESWTKYVNIFLKSINFIILEEVISGKITDQNEIDALELKARYYAQIYSETTKAHSKEMFISTAIDIKKYLNFYQVYPKDGEYDEFKGIYFTGMAVSKKLEFLELLDLNKIHLKAVLGLMDCRLDIPHKISRKVLSERIHSMIDNNVIDAHLGKYGWYIIYKCLFNSVNEKAPQPL